MNTTESRKQQRYDLCTEYLGLLQASSGLDDLFDLHKDIWNAGLRHPNIGPDPFGMFRTDNITTMSRSEVFLGNMNGLWTLPLKEWIGTPEEHIVTEQYRHHLIANVELLRSQVFDHGLDREKIERSIAREAPEGIRITDLKIIDKEMDVLKLMHFSFKANGIPMQSNLFLKVLSLKDDLLVIPENWYKGEHAQSIHQLHKIPFWTGVGHKGSLFTLKKEFLRRSVAVAVDNREVQKRLTPKIKR